MKEQRSGSRRASQPKALETPRHHHKQPQKRHSLRWRASGCSCASSWAGECNGSAVPAEVDARNTPTRATHSAPTKNVQRRRHSQLQRAESATWPHWARAHRATGSPALIEYPPQHREALLAEHRTSGAQINTREYLTDFPQAGGHTATAPLTSRHPQPAPAPALSHTLP